MHILSINARFKKKSIAMIAVDEASPAVRNEGSSRENAARSIPTMVGREGAVWLPMDTA